MNPQALSFGGPCVIGVGPINLLLECTCGLRPDLYSKREVPWEFVEGVIELLISLKGDDSSPSTPLIGAVSRVCSKAQDVVVTLKVIA